MQNARFYNILYAMRQRCYYDKHPQYYAYGGRGIKICSDWLLRYNPHRKKFLQLVNRGIVADFAKWALAHGYQDNLTIDRIDNDKGYSPDNCRFSNKQTQELNKGKFRNTSSQYRGVTWNKHHKSWKASLRLDKQAMFIGYFKDELDAAKAYNAYIVANNLPNKINEFK